MYGQVPAVTERKRFWVFLVSIFLKFYVFDIKKINEKLSETEIKNNQDVI